jgi:hypothetical protein
MSKESAIEYFQAFAAKDIIFLRGMFANDVSLRDWDLCAEGLDAVIAANLNIFNAVKTIIVSPVKLFVDENVVLAELHIEIDGSEPLKIMDVLEFDRSGKICAIRAYKG